MEIEVLQEIGFSQAEAKVYLTLLRSGPVKVGHIIEKSGLQSSTIHNTLHSLIDKGYVTYFLKGKIKIYQAVNPKLVLELYKEKEKKFKNLLPKLELMEDNSKNKQKAEIFEGINGIMAMLNILIENSKKGDIYYFFALDVEGSNDIIQKFFQNYDQKRRIKGLKVRGLAEKKLKDLFSNRKYIEMRYVDFPIPSNISICNNKMVLFQWGDKPSGILIESKQIIDSQINLFNQLWKIARS